jgi:ABC-type nitrate/sulfonate/bicarbonate transport system permease component
MKRVIPRKVILPVILVVLWWAIIRFGHISPFILPDPKAIIKEFAELLANGVLPMHAYVSLRRSLGGFLLGSVLGVLSGILMGWSRFWDDFFDLPINFIRSVPKTALAPLFIVWFGLGDTAKVLLIAFSSYFFTVIPTIEGVKNVDKAYVKSARSMGASQWQIMSTVIFPAAMPSIFAGIRLAVTTSLLVLVMVEVIAGNNGLGYLLEESRASLDMPTMFATLLTLGILGYYIDILMQYLSRVIMPWRKGKTISE